MAKPNPKEVEPTLEHVSIKLDSRMIDQIDEYARQRGRRDGAEWSRSNAIRVLLTQALAHPAV